VFAVGQTGPGDQPLLKCDKPAEDNSPTSGSRLVVTVFVEALQTYVVPIASYSHTRTSSNRLVSIP
jgi:hypothetical protein